MEGRAPLNEPGERPDVALDAPRTRHLSVGMQAYVDELVQRLPRVAADLHFAVLPRARSLSLGEQIGLPIALRRLRARLVHFMSVYAPVFPPKPYAITIHDLIHLHFPDQFKRTVGTYYATVVRAVCARAARVITDDPRTIDDLTRYLAVPAEKIRVVSLGVDDRFLAEGIAPFRAERPYFIYAGNHRLHKDLATLFEAWAALDEACAVDLYLTGPDDLPADSVRRSRKNGSLRFLGEVGTDALASLYAGSIGLVYPSLREGFGLPMLEAAAVGAPVIASRDAVPSGLAPYARTFVPRDVRGLGGLMQAALETPLASEEARRFARSQTWDLCAARTAEVYREILRETAR